MRQRLTFLLSLILLSVHSQDTTRTPKLGLYDCTLYAAFDFIQNESQVNLPYIQSFTADRKHAFNNLSFPDTVSYSLYADPYGETDGGEFGLNLTFRFKEPRNNLSGRLRPRAGLYYSYIQFFTYNVNLTRHHITDTLNRYSADSYTLKDSVMLRNLIYSYYSEQLYLQLGFNYELIQRPHYALYTGLLMNGSVSFKNEFSSQLTDLHRSDLVSSYGERTEGEPKVILSGSHSSTESISHSFRIGVPMGICWRFLRTEKFSLGFTIEGRLAAEHYQIDRGRSVNYLLYAAGAGLRFSFYSHHQRE